MFSKFFINRPIFASVISIAIVIAGSITIPLLPIEQTPDITPPTVQVKTNYPGASAEVVAETVATPIEEQVNLYRHRFNYVFTSGGLGPTHDDVTVEGVARALGAPVVRNPVLEKKLMEYTGGKMDEAGMKMAQVPEGAVLHFCDQLQIPVVSCSERSYSFSVVSAISGSGSL